MLRDAHFVALLSMRDGELGVSERYAVPLYSKMSKPTWRSTT